MNDKNHDVSGEFVLIATRFYYFGKSPITVSDHLRPNIPAGQSAHGSFTHDVERALAFITFVTKVIRLAFMIVHINGRIMT